MGFMQDPSVTFAYELEEAPAEDKSPARVRRHPQSRVIPHGG